MISKRRESVNTAPLYLKNMHIDCGNECDLVGITLSSIRTSDNVIEKAVMKFNMKSKQNNHGFQIFTMLYVYNFLY